MSAAVAGSLKLPANGAPARRQGRSAVGAISSATSAHISSRKRPRPACSDNMDEVAAPAPVRQRVSYRRPRASTMPSMVNPPPRFSSPPRKPVMTSPLSPASQKLRISLQQIHKGAAFPAGDASSRHAALMADLCSPSSGPCKAAVATTRSSSPSAPVAAAPKAALSSPPSSSSSSASRSSSPGATPAPSSESPPVTPQRRSRTSSFPAAARKNHSPRSAIAMLLRKAVNMYTQAVAALAKAKGKPAPRDSDGGFLHNLSPTPQVAIQLLRRTMAIYRSIFGDKHASTAACYKLIGCILVHSEDRASREVAMKCFKKALARCEADFGASHPVTIDVLYNIGLLHSQIGQHQQAAAVFSRVLGVYEATHGQHSSITRFIRGKLKHSRRGNQTQLRYTELYSEGSGLLEDGAGTAALAAFQQCLDLIPEDCQAAYSIACCHSQLGDAATAMTWFARAVEWGFDDVQLITADDDIALLRTLDEFWALVESRFRVARPKVDAEAKVSPTSVHAASPIAALPPSPPAAGAVLRKADSAEAEDSDSGEMVPMLTAHHSEAVSSTA